MGIIRALLIIVEVIVSVLGIAVILLQKSKDEGLGLAFGANVGETLFGSRAGNVLTRITVVLGAVFLVNTLILVLLYERTPQKTLLDRIPDQAVPAAAAPAQPGPGTGPYGPAESPAPVAPAAPAIPVTPAVPAMPAPAAPAPAPAAGG